MRPSSCRFYGGAATPCLLISVEFLMVVISDDAGTGHLLGEMGESSLMHSYMLELLRRQRGRSHDGTVLQTYWWPDGGFRNPYSFLNSLLLKCVMIRENDLRPDDETIVLLYLG